MKVTQCRWHLRFTFTLIILYMHRELLKIDLQMTSHIYKSNDSLQLSADRNMGTQLVTTLHTSSTKKPLTWHFQIFLYIYCMIVWIETCMFCRISCFIFYFLSLGHFLYICVFFTCLLACYFQFFDAVVTGARLQKTLQSPVVCHPVSCYCSTPVWSASLSSRCRLWWQTRGVWRCGPGLCQWLNLSLFFSPQVSHF